MDMITPDEHTAEVAALNHEIYELTRQLNEQKAQNELLRRAPETDRQNPFDNPTEYVGYNEDYSEIQPRITEEGYKLPLDPDRTEIRNLRKYYTIGGWCLLLHNICSVGMILLMTFAIVGVLKGSISGLTSSEMSKYMSNTSINAAMNMVVCLFCNVIFALLGMKAGRIKASSLLKTKDYGVSICFQYCMISTLITFVASVLNLAAQNVLGKYGLSSTGEMDTKGMTSLGVAITCIYAVVIAPITEELLFRGVLLRLFSKANQRFAIIATALFFGLFHMNVQQFIFTSLFGLFLAHITMKHGSIIPAITVHMFNNILATFSSVGVPFIIKHFGVDKTTINGIMGMCVIGCAALGVLLLLVFWGSDKIPATTPQQSRRGLAVAATSLPFLTAAAVVVGMTVYNVIG